MDEAMHVSGAVSADGGISVRGTTSQEPATLTTVLGYFLNVADPAVVLGLNTENGQPRTSGVPAVWLAIEGNYANNTYQPANPPVTCTYSEAYFQGIDAAGKSIRPLAFTWDNSNLDNFMAGHIYISPKQGFAVLRTSDDAVMFNVGGDGITQTATAIDISSANPWIQAANAIVDLAIITGSQYVWFRQDQPGLKFGVAGDATIYRSAPNVLTSDSLLQSPGQRSLPVTVSALPAASEALEGARMAVTDSTTDVWGDVAVGGGSQHVGVYCNGTSWTVSAK